MKVFISYSLNDTEQYILSILAKKLKEQGYVISTGYNLMPGFQNNQNLSQIDASHLFIGILSGYGNAKLNVVQEWQHAKSKKIPALLLVENNIVLTPQSGADANVIRFDRNNPEPSIETVRNKINLSRVPAQDNNDNAWLFGGLAILALIGLLSSNKD